MVERDARTGRTGRTNGTHERTGRTNERTGRTGRKQEVGFFQFLEFFLEFGTKREVVPTKSTDLKLNDHFYLKPRRTIFQTTTLFWF